MHGSAFSVSIPGRAFRATPVDRLRPKKLVLDEDSTTRDARVRRDRARCLRSVGGTPEKQPPSVGFLDENESGALDYGSARADERDVDVLDLAFPGTSRRLQCSLDDVPETMDAARPQASTEGVQRELAVQLHASVLDEIQRFSLLAEPVGLEAVDDRGGEAVVDLRHVDLFRGEARSLPGEARRAAAALHVAAEAPDASRHLERQPLTVARNVRRARP